jgi:mono/diheme cytochrome c family protein
MATVIFLLIAINISCNQEPYKQGRILYENFCANCHMEDGTGLPGIIPPLAGADFVEENQESLPCLIRYGIQTPLSVNGNLYTTPMEGVPKLTEFEITNVINYINTSWGNDYGIVKHLDVRQQLEQCR